MRPERPSHNAFATLFDIVAESGVTAAAVALTGQLVGSDDFSTDTVDRGGSRVSPASMNLLEDDFNPGEDSSAASDLRLKTDISKVSTTVYGLPLYHFRYKGQDAVYEGVMAQDVADVMPSAVLKGEDGFLRVNYGSLGISMRKIA